MVGLIKGETPQQKRQRIFAQKELDRIDAERASEKRALKGIDPADEIFQSALLKKISLAKAEKRKRDPLDFTSGTLRGL